MSTRYDSPPNAASQCGLILCLLKSRAGEWVPLPEILKLGVAQYNTRIKELRDEWNLSIENRTETVDGVRHSWFRLNPSPVQERAEEPSRFAQAHRKDLERETPLFAGGAP